MLASDDIMDVFLQPGELWFGDEGTRMRTLLGSCVAMTLWHPQRRIGGMTHCLLPTDVRGGGLRDADSRFVDEALMIMLREALAADTNPADYQFKLFGGADMIVGKESTDRMRIGEKNVAKARRILTALGLNLAAEDVGGNRHRNLIFEVATGDVWVSRSSAVEESVTDIGATA